MGREARKVPANWEHPKDENGNFVPLLEARYMLEEPSYSQEDCMPDWKESEMTHYMLYETCSEGTPLSPAFPTKEMLASWLEKNSASYFGDLNTCYHTWMNVIEEGVSGVLVYKKN